MSKYYSLFPCLILLLCACCQKEQGTGPLPGEWHASLETVDGNSLPFTFSLSKEGSLYKMEIYNADEVVAIDEISISGDSIIIRMPVFEEYIAATFTASGMEGSLINESRGRKVPFLARPGASPRFANGRSPAVDVSGTWEVHFSPGTENEYPAMGIFSQEDGRVTGTFRTTTGDYRFLEGVVQGDSLKLSTFDGTHAYLFRAVVTDSLLEGTYYSGNHWKTEFVGQRNPDFELADVDSLTFLKPGYDRLEFEFPDTNGNLVSLQDSRFHDKVVVVQLMGSWCPNCLDETRFLASYLKGHQDQEVEVVALAFEYAKTEEKALAALSRLKERVGVDYPILLAQYGGADKSEASEKLPMLNRVWSYPTLIFLDRQAKVRRIHSGFNGPATGEKYEEFKKDFEVQLEELLAE